MNDRIVIVQSVFIDNEKHLDKCLNAFQHIMQYWSLHQYKHLFVICGYINDYESDIRECMDKFTKKNNYKIFNYKNKMSLYDYFNQTIKKLEYDYVLFLKSYYFFPLEQKHIIERCVDSVKHINDHFHVNFGYLALNLENKHPQHAYANRFTFKNQYNKVETVAYPRHKSGILNECLFLSKKMLHEYQLTDKLIKQLKNYSASIFESIVIEN